MEQYDGMPVWHASTSIFQTRRSDWRQGDERLLAGVLANILDCVGHGDAWREDEPSNTLAVQAKKFLSERERCELPHDPLDIRRDRRTVFRRLAPVGAALGIPIPQLARMEGL